MAFENGDFVKIDYDEWRAADNALVFTTDRKTAEANGVLDKDATYRPALVIVGKGSIIKGVDKAVSGMNVNEEKNIELAPADAYGERNPQLVRIMPAAEFKKRDIDPMPGMRINLDGIAATVKTVNSGRVVIDANHPLAGEKLRCRIKIVAKVDSDKDKISALSEMLNLSPKSVEVNDGSAKIVFDEKTKKDADFMVSKSALVDAVFKYLDKINHVSVDELYSKEAEKQPEKETEKQ